jgi:two-component system, sensor histidine kinase
MASPINDMMTEGNLESQRILFVPQNPHDARTAREVFAAANLELQPLENVAEAIDEIEAGAGALFIAAEQLDGPDFGRLVTWLQSQPAWSDLPVIVATGAGRLPERARYLSKLANATLIERPIHLEPLVSTVRAALRDRRRQYDMRRSIANRDSFLAMLGHELRNPLAAIILGLQQLEIDPGSDDALGIIRRQSSNLERIVDDLLEVSRISRGVISFDKERVDVVEIVRVTADAYEHIAADEGLELTVTLPDEPLWVDGDAVRLEQALGNLLSNAVRYTPAGGSIQVSAERDDGAVVVYVRDSGMGIPAQMTDNIFEIFAQAHGDFSRREGGLGLGLSLVNSIIEKHDGQVVAQSEGEGKGSLFSVRLPAADDKLGDQDVSSTASSSPEHADEPIEGPSEFTDERPLHLLVVEDVDDVRRPLCQMLRLRGYRVDEAASGGAALEVACSDAHDVILLDIGLPDIDGYEVARRIRRLGRSLPIIALTGYGRKQDREQAEEAGIDALLTKPVRLDELEEILPRASERSAG